MSASGFEVQATATASASGITIEETLSQECHATAANSGECSGFLNGVEAADAGEAHTTVFAVSGAPSSPGSLSTSGGSATSTSGPKKNNGFKHHFNQKMLAGLAFGTTILGICSGGFLLL